MVLAGRGLFGATYLEVRFCLREAWAGPSACQPGQINIKVCGQLITEARQTAIKIWLLRLKGSSALLCSAFVELGAGKFQRALRARQGGDRAYFGERGSPFAIGTPILKFLALGIAAGNWQGWPTREASWAGCLRAQVRWELPSSFCQLTSIALLLSALGWQGSGRGSV